MLTTLDLDEYLRAVVNGYGLMAVEDLITKGLAGSMLAKSIHDAGWGQFLRFLADNASIAGRLLIAVNAASNTPACSGCGGNVPKDPAERWHTCAGCGLSLCPRSPPGLAVGVITA